MRITLPVVLTVIGLVFGSGIGGTYIASIRADERLTLSVETLKMQQSVTSATAKDLNIAVVDIRQKQALMEARLAEIDNNASGIEELRKLHQDINERMIRMEALLQALVESVRELKETR